MVHVSVVMLVFAFQFSKLDTLIFAGPCCFIFHGVSLHAKCYLILQSQEYFLILFLTPEIRLLNTLQMFCLFLTLCQSGYLSSLPF